MGAPRCDIAWPAEMYIFVIGVFFLVAALGIFKRLNNACVCMQVSSRETWSEDANKCWICHNRAQVSNRVTDWERQTESRPPIISTRLAIPVRGLNSKRIGDTGRLARATHLFGCRTVLNERHLPMLMTVWVISVDPWIIGLVSGQTRRCASEPADFCRRSANKGADCAEGETRNGDASDAA